LEKIARTYSFVEELFTLVPSLGLKERRPQKYMLVLHAGVAQPQILTIHPILLGIVVHILQEVEDEQHNEKQKSLVVSNQSPWFNEPQCSDQPSHGVKNVTSRLEEIVKYLGGCIC
jgi:hypothetical protein